ncbi:unnamed protein product, partial [Allacma fusca]
KISSFEPTLSGHNLRYPTLFSSHNLLGCSQNFHPISAHEFRLSWAHN